jgi:hypothetical protein
MESKRSLHHSVKKAISKIKARKSMGVLGGWSDFIGKLE